MYKHLEIEETPEDENKVQLLNKIIKNNHTVILYHASWCGHCKNLMPTWNAATKTPMKLKDLNETHSNDNFIIKIENSYKDILSGIELGNSFPTIYLYKKGVKIDEFNKDRTVANLKAFFKNLIHKKQKKKRKQRVKSLKGTKKRRSISLKKGTKKRRKMKQKNKRKSRNSK
jgi:thiol-disulfide isomerase/thioredoxin